MKAISPHRALLLGGTGAMDVYLQDELVSAGWELVITSRFHCAARPGVTFAEGNAKDPLFPASLASESCDVVVDFMTWSPRVFEGVLPKLLGMSGQYVFLSSYRVFADSPVIMESSPRLLEDCPDRRYATSVEYVIAKAREEDLLRSSESSGWTNRPSRDYLPRHPRGGRMVLAGASRLSGANDARGAGTGVHAVVGGGATWRA